ARHKPLHTGVPGRFLARQLAGHVVIVPLGNQAFEAVAVVVGDGAVGVRVSDFRERGIVVPVHVPRTGLGALEPGVPALAGLAGHVVIVPLGNQAFEAVAVVVGDGAVGVRVSDFRERGIVVPVHVPRRGLGALEPGVPVFAGLAVHICLHGLLGRGGMHVGAR